MNSPGVVFEPPFAPTSHKSTELRCTCCGTTGLAEKQISTYPHRYMPSGWSFNGITRGLRCVDCTDRQIEEPRFAMSNNVWSDGDITEGGGKASSALRYDQAMALHSPSVPLDGVMRIMAHEVEEGTRMTRVKKQVAETAQAVGMGMQLAAANEAGEILVDLASELFSDNQMAQLMLKHPDGRELAKMLMAMLLQTGAEQTNLLPNPEAISHICKLQLTQSTSTLVAPRLKKVRRHLTKLAKLGSTVGAAADASSPLRARISDDLDDLDEVRDQNAALLEELRELRQEMDEIRGTVGGTTKKKSKERTAG